MKKVHLTGNGQIDLIEAPLPEPRPGEVRVRTVLSALCGSEMGDYRRGGVAGGNNGHEAVGVIDALGEGVENWTVGQRVGVSAIAGCGNCPYCAAGQYTWCNTFSFHGHMHAEAFTLPALACHALPDDLDWEPAVLVSGDGLGVPFHSARKIADPDLKTIVVFGLGPIGLGNVLMQKHYGRRIFGVDLSPERRAMATELGAEQTFDPREIADLPAHLRELTDGFGPDVCMECAGIPPTLRQAFACVRKGGIVVLNGEQGPLELSPSDDFIRRDITAKGAWFYHFSEFPAMLEAQRNGLQVERLITHRFPLEEAAQAYTAMAQGKSGKVLLTYS
jgi:threonine dehydrogenase-like Zn-dependent dehydrogenase